MERATLAPIAIGGRWRVGVLALAPGSWGGIQ